MQPPSGNAVTSYRNSSKYRRFRELRFRESPLCELCREQGLSVAATDMDHILPLSDRWDLRWAVSNIQMLCKDCHAAKTKAENEERWQESRGHLWDKFQARLQEMMDNE